MAMPHVSFSSSREQLVFGKMYPQGLINRSKMHLPLHRLVAAPDVLHHLHPKCAAQGSELNLLPARPSLEVISLTFVSPLLADIWLLAADSEAAVSAENTLLCESYTVSTGKLLKGHG